MGNKNVKFKDIFIDQLAGDVIQCIYADFPEGCGETTHCSGCAIRNTAEKTYETGESQKNVKAYQILKTAQGPKHKIILLSTEKVGDRVLLQIDDMVDDTGSAWTIIFWIQCLLFLCFSSLESLTKKLEILIPSDLKYFHD